MCAISFNPGRLRRKRADIFISYASADRPRVKPLVDALQKQGWSVWWDRTIRAGRTFDRVIDAAFNDARCVMVLWSHASIDSDWVRTEADEGKRRGILVPALLDDLDVVKIPLAFRRIQAANLVGWPGALPSAQFDELALAVSEVLSGSAHPPPDAKQAAAETARLEQEERNRLAAVEKARLEQERQAAEEKVRLERAERLSAPGRVGPPTPLPAIVPRALKTIALAVCGILVVAPILYWATRPKQPQVAAATAATISFFKASPDTIQAGEQTKLVWETQNATNVFISLGIGKFAPTH